MIIPPTVVLIITVIGSKMSCLMLLVLAFCLSVIWVICAVAGRKYASLAAHASQSDNIFFLEMGEELFAQMMGSESFVRVLDSTNAPVPEDDLFAGLR